MYYLYKLKLKNIKKLLLFKRLRMRKDHFENKTHSYKNKFYYSISFISKPKVLITVSNFLKEINVTKELHYEIYTKFSFHKIKISSIIIAIFIL